MKKMGYVSFVHSKEKFFYIIRQFNSLLPQAALLGFVTFNYVLFLMITLKVNY